MIFITGDTHIPDDVHKLNTTNFPRQKELSKSDYVIICGDFGGVWYPEDSKYHKEDLYWRKWFDEKPFTTLFVDGNHENHVLLSKLPEVEMFGGIVGKVNDSVYHLKRGQVYTIEGKKFFCFGGAKSTDREWRVEGLSWWPEEMPTKQEMDYGLETLKKHDYKVDYIISHCAPSLIQWEMDSRFDNDALTNYFDTVAARVNFKSWFFGHYHRTEIIKEKFIALFDAVVGLGE